MVETRGQQQHAVRSNGRSNLSSRSVGPPRPTQSPDNTAGGGQAATRPAPSARFIDDNPPTHPRAIAAEQAKKIASVRRDSERRNEARQTLARWAAAGKQHMAASPLQVLRSQHEPRNALDWRAPVPPGSQPAIEQLESTRTDSTRFGKFLGKPPFLPLDPVAPVAPASEPTPGRSKRASPRSSPSAHLTSAPGQGNGHTYSEFARIAAEMGVGEHIQPSASTNQSSSGSKKFPPQVAAELESAFADGPSFELFKQTRDGRWMYYSDAAGPHFFLQISEFRQWMTEHLGLPSEDELPPDYKEPLPMRFFQRMFNRKTLRAEQEYLNRVFQPFGLDFSLPEDQVVQLYREEGNHSCAILKHISEDDDEGYWLYYDPNVKWIARSSSVEIGEVLLAEYGIWPDFLQTEHILMLADDKIGRSTVGVPKKELTYYRVFREQKDGSWLYWTAQNGFIRYADLEEARSYAYPAYRGALPWYMEDPMPKWVYYNGMGEDLEWGPVSSTKQAKPTLARKESSGRSLASSAMANAGDTPASERSLASSVRVSAGDASVLVLDYGSPPRGLLTRRSNATPSNPASTLPLWRPSTTTSPNSRGATRSGTIFYKSQSPTDGSSERVQKKKAGHKKKAAPKKPRKTATSKETVAPKKITAAKKATPKANVAATKAPAAPVRRSSRLAAAKVKEPVSKVVKYRKAITLYREKLSPLSKPRISRPIKSDRNMVSKKSTQSGVLLAEGIKKTTAKVTRSTTKPTEPEKSKRPSHDIDYTKHAEPEIRKKPKYGFDYSEPHDPDRRHAFAGSDRHVIKTKNEAVIQGSSLPTKPTTAPRRSPRLAQKATDDSPAAETKAKTPTPASKKTVTKRSVTKKVVTKEIGSKKTVTKKVVTKKAGLRKTVMKKTVTKKTAAKRTPANKAPTKTASAEKAPAKQILAAPREEPMKSALKKTSLTGSVSEAGSSPRRSVSFSNKVISFPPEQHRVISGHVTKSPSLRPSFSSQNAIRTLSPQTRNFPGVIVEARGSQRPESYQDLLSFDPTGPALSSMMEPRYSAVSPSANGTALPRGVVTSRADHSNSVRLDYSNLYPAPISYPFQNTTPFSYPNIAYEQQEQLASKAGESQSNSRTRPALAIQIPRDSPSSPFDDESTHERLGSFYYRANSIPSGSGLSGASPINPGILSSGYASSPSSAGTESSSNVELSPQFHSSGQVTSTTGRNSGSNKLQAKSKKKAGKEAKNGEVKKPARKNSKSRQSTRSPKAPTVQVGGKRTYSTRDTSAPPEDSISPLSDSHSIEKAAAANKRRKLSHNQVESPNRRRSKSPKQTSPTRGSVQASPKPGVTTFPNEMEVKTETKSWRWIPKLW